MKRSPSCHLYSPFRASGALALALVLAVSAHAEIRAFSGRLSAIAQGTAQAPQDSFARDDDSYAITLSPPTVDASAELSTTDIDGTPLAEGRALAILGDPTVSTLPNPGEFALEAGAFSNEPRIGYRMTTSAAELRRVRFSPADLSSTPFLNSGIQGEATSLVFLSGALVFWSTDADLDLTGAEAEVSIVVRDNRLSDATPVLEIRRRFVGDAAGAVQVAEDVQSGVRGREFQTRILNLDQLRAERAPEAAALADQADRLGITTFVVVLISPQEITYGYAFELNRTFELEAEFTLAVESAPTGMGVTGVMGRPFAGLADLFQDSRAGAEGDGLQKSINKLIDRTPGGSGAGDDAISSAPIGAAPCGALGGPALWGLLPLFLVRRRARRGP